MATVTTRKAAAERFLELASRFEGFVAAPYAKSIHLVVDLDQHRITAARLLESATQREFLSDRWPVAYLQSDREGLVSKLIRYKSEKERLALFWTFSIGSWLQLEYPTEFRADAGKLDWLHHRTTDTYRAAWAEFAPKFLDCIADARAGRLPPESKRVRFEAPEGSFVCIEEQYDKSDVLARHRMRAQAYADACRLLAKLIRPRAVDDGAAKTRAGATGQTRNRSRRTEPNTEMVKVWNAKNSGLSFRAIAKGRKKLGLKGTSPTTLSVWCKIADATLNPKPRSKRVRARLPEDERGQVSSSQDRRFNADSDGNE